MLFVFAAMFVSFAAAILLIEIALRIYDPLKLPAEDLRGFYRLDAHGRIETAPGWTGNQTVDGRSIPIHMNSLGLRGPEIPARGPDERRVLLLGDSFVWGMGVLDGETIPARLEQALRVGRAKTTVGNAGMYGTSPREWGYTLDRFRGSFEPDLVVATMYVGNDVLDAMQEPLSVVDGWLMTSGPAGVARTSWRFRMMVTSRLWNHFERLLQNKLESMAFASIKPVGPGLSLAEALFLDRDPARDVELPFLGEVEATLAADFRDFASAGGAVRRFVVLLPGHEVALKDYGELLAANNLDPALHQRGRGHA
ncbi:MAG: hypothetical protein Q7T30_04405, partial [Planctomycetota bacterium]|nr:hypothetical protein [Planctomycetota bacterium]